VSEKWLQAKVKKGEAVLYAFHGKFLALPSKASLA